MPQISSGKRAATLRSADVRLTHPDRVLYPEQGITKADLARYYLEVADRMLPHLSNRPLMLVRCPEGEGESDETRAGKQLTIRHSAPHHGSPSKTC